MLVLLMMLCQSSVGVAAGVGEGCFVLMYYSAGAHRVFVIYGFVWYFPMHLQFSRFSVRVAVTFSVQGFKGCEGDVDISLAPCD